MKPMSRGERDAKRNFVFAYILVRTLTTALTHVEAFFSVC